MNKDLPIYMVVLVLAKSAILMKDKKDDQDQDKLLEHDQDDLIQSVFVARETLVEQGFVNHFLRLILKYL